jgi:hypothetical protein
MKEIPLSRNCVAMIDDEDHYWISRRVWHVAINPEKTNLKYAKTWVKIDGKEKTPSMHRLIMGCPEGFVVDHIDGNTLNNQKSNLRICSNSQNIRNNKACGVSGFKGVRKNWNKYQARIRHDSKEIHIGLFSTPESAAAAYDEAALRLHGSFARTNKMMGKL